MPEKLYCLPNGWSKRCTQREVGTSAGKWDVYLTSPDGAKLRSNPDLIRYLETTGMANEIDESYINLENCERVEENQWSSSYKRLVEAINYIRQGGGAKVDPNTSEPYHTYQNRDMANTDQPVNEFKSVEMFYYRKRRLNRNVYLSPNRRMQFRGHPHHRVTGPGHNKKIKHHFSQSQENYLHRQRGKLGGLPSYDQCIYMSMQLKCEPHVIKEWFARQEREEDEDDFWAPPKRKPRSFDVTIDDCDIEPLPLSDMIDSEFLIETDNPELYA